jgi:hypothetical protein
MTQWIITTYSQKKLIEYKKLGVLVLIPLFFLINFLVSVPYFVGYFSMSVESLFANNEGLKPALLEVFEKSGCELDGSVTCQDPNMSWISNGYTIYIQPTAHTEYKAKEIVILADRVIITNAQSVIMVSGSYENIGATSFSALYAQMKTDPEVLNIIVKDLVLSELSSNMLRQYLMLFFQNLIYVFVLGAALFIGFGWKSQKKLSFMESISINVQMMFSPALLSAFIGMYNPGMAVVAFPIVLTLRFLLLYRTYIRIKQ